MKVPLDNLAISALQISLAATFFVIAFAARAYGDGAQQAAEKSVSDQSIDSRLLLENGVKFTESRIEMLLPLAIGTLLAVTGIFNLFQDDIARMLSFVLAPAVFLVVGPVTAGQIFPAHFLKRSFARSEDPEVRRIDAQALIHAANGVYPSWLRGLQIVRFLLATVGSLVILVLLLVGI